MITSTKPEKTIMCGIVYRIGMVVVSCCLLLMLCGLLFNSCSGSGGSSSPTGPGEGVLDTVKIGSEGGSLETETLSVTIPAEAFAAPVTLSLTEYSESFAGDNEVSEIYMLSGIPADYTKAIEVRMKFDGELSDENFIAVGEVTYNIFSDTNVLAYYLVPAVESEGYLEASIPPPLETGMSKHAGIQNGSDDSLEWVLAAITGIVPLESDQKHFKTDFPAFCTAESQALCAFLEEIYDSYTGMGLTFSKPGSGQTGREIIEIYYNHNSFFTVPVVGVVSDNKIGISVNPEYIPVPLDTATKCNWAKALLMYIGICTHPDASTEQFWLYQAISEWIGTTVSEDNAYIPEEFVKNRTALLTGAHSCLENASINERFSYAKSMTALVEYLNQTYNITAGDHVLANMMENMREGNDGITAISTCINAGPHFWWPAFMRAYLGGDVFDMTSSTLITEKTITEAFEITPEDTLASFSGYYNNLSTKMFGITYPDSLVDRIDSIEFTIASYLKDDPDASLQIYGVKNGKFNLLGYGSEITIHNIADASDTRQIVTAVVNSKYKEPYNGTTVIPFDVHASLKPPREDNTGVFETTRGVLEFLILDVNCKPKNPETCTRQFCRLDKSFDYYTGNWNGSTFSATWDDYIPESDWEQERRETGSMQITLDETGNSVSEFEVAQTTVYYDYLGGDELVTWLTYTSAFNWSGMPIPLNQSSMVDNFNYRLQGMDICGNLVLELEDTDHNTGCVMVFDNIECSEYTSIRIGFRY